MTLMTATSPRQAVNDGIDPLRRGARSVPYLVATQWKRSSYHRYAIVVAPDPLEAAARVYRKSYCPELPNEKFHVIVDAMTLTGKSESVYHYRTRNRRHGVEVVDPVDVLLASMPDVSLGDRFKRETRLRAAYELSTLDINALRDIIAALRTLRVPQPLQTAFLLAVEIAREQLCDSS